MSERVTMPALGESVTEGTVTRWLKQVGDSVEVDEPLVEVSTDKVDTEIPSPVAGVVEEILVQEDETADVGADLVVIGDGSGAGSSGGSSEDSSEGSAAEAAKESDSSEPETAETVEETAPDKPSTDSEEEEKAPSASSGGSSGGSVSGGEKVTMPALGESVTEGTVTRWLKAEGDDVEVDEPLLEVSTDKVDTEIPSPVAGKLTKILVQEDETAEVGADLAIIGGEASGGSDDAPAPKEEPKAEEKPEEKPEEPKQEAPKAEEKAEEKQEEAPAQEASEELSDKAAGESAPAPAPAKSESKDSGDASAYVTPLVRKLAAEHGIDLGSVTGTGVGGRIRKQDILEAAEKAKAPAPAPAAAPSAPAAGSGAAPAPAAKATVSAEATAKRGTSEKMSRLRKVIAERMVESLQISAQLTAAVEVDMTRVAQLRAKAKEDFAKREGAKLTYLPFIAQATVETLKAYPNLNASVEGDQITYHASENLGIAVDTPRGLLVPVIKDAGDLNIAGLSRKIADLAERTRTNKVTPDELGGGTFTITNIGSNGSMLDTPIINQPNVAILGTGAIVKRPVVLTDAEGNDTIAIRQMMYLVLTYDHRVVDGADAGRFLTALKARLEEGRFEAELGL